MKLNENRLQGIEAYFRLIMSQQFPLHHYFALFSLQKTQTQAHTWPEPPTNKKGL